jgi:NADH dehydrogenase/NADH:ubiquinone oxidoreductase subunit G
MIRLIVDGKEIEAKQGTSLLEACLDSRVYIPNLCFMKGMKEPPASCRLCFVEIEGRNKPVASCKVEPGEGMVVRTDTPPVRRLQRTALRLLLSAHEADCRNCPSNKKCELQRMVKLLGVRLRPRRFEHLGRELPQVQDHPFFEMLPSRCVLCGKCVHVCRKRNGVSLLTFARRGFNTVVSGFGVGSPSDYPCRECLACVEICPVSAILLKDIPFVMDT